MNETTTGAPLTATLGERVGDDPHVKQVREEVEHASAAPREGREARRRAGSRGGGGSFPWGALALAAVGWALASGIVRGIGGRARRLVSRPSRRRWTRRGR